MTGTPSKVGKIAVTLMLKDEVAEILPWLGWYLGLGVDTIIVYDDRSTDGTWELLQQAAARSDIRVSRLEPTDGSFILRQSAAYCETLRRYRDEFEWIGFFDSDEYLALYQHASIHAFLDRPDDVGSVAINWCNYGSGGHVFRPVAFPFIAYTEHFAAMEPINRLVKSFVRPRAWDGVWHNPHYYATGTLRTVDAAGDDVVWSNEKAVTLNPPDWSVAKVMHYQCRSMEHFFDRMRKRDDLEPDTKLWREYDKGNEKDQRPIERLEQVRNWVYSVCVTPPPHLPDLLQRRREDSGDSAPASQGLVSKIRSILASAPDSTPASEQRVTFEVFLPRGIARQMLTFNPESGLIYVTDGNASPENIVCAVRLSSAPARLFLLRPLTVEAPIICAGDPRLASCLPVDMVGLDGQTVALQHPASKRFLSAEPRQFGDVWLDRRFVKDWEKFLLVIIPRETLPESAVLQFIDHLTRAPDPASFLGERLRSGDGELVMAMMPLWIELLAPETASLLRGALGGLAYYML